MGNKIKNLDEILGNKHSFLNFLKKWDKKIGL